jgi:hypothetical protein
MQQGLNTWQQLIMYWGYIAYMWFKQTYITQRQPTGMCLARFGDAMCMVVAGCM